MNTHRMAACLCAFICVLASGFFTGHETASAASQKTTRVEKQIDLLEKVEWKSTTAIAFFKENPKRRWMLHANQQDKPCWEVKLSGPMRLCMIAREAVRVHTKKLRQVQARIARLEAQLLDTGNEKHWNCIHRHERHPYQGWATNTGNGYFGGLQMDRNFMASYGRDMVLKYGGRIVYIDGHPYAYGGEAHLWTPEEQMHVAQKAKDSGRGYYPWPNTARYCGLI